MVLTFYFHAENSIEFTTPNKTRSFKFDPFWLRWSCSPSNFCLPKSEAGTRNQLNGFFQTCWNLLAIRGACIRIAPPQFLLRQFWSYAQRRNWNISWKTLRESITIHILNLNLGYINWNTKTSIAELGTFR